MGSRSQTDAARPGDTLLVIHDFTARSPDELSLTKGDRIELIERDDEFGDGWFLGTHLRTGENGLFPEVYTALVPKGTTVRRTQGPAAQATAGAPVDGLNNTTSKSNGNEIRDSPKTAPPKTAAEVPSSATTPVPDPPGNGGKDMPEPQKPLPELPTGHLGSIAASSSPSTPRRLASGSSVRSLSYSNGIHENSPVMNETLSVIEEHITDMNSPRRDLLPSSKLRNDASLTNGSGVGTQSGEAYIHGQETDEEEDDSYTEQTVLKWTPAQVSEFLRTRGVDEHQCQVFRDEEITGEVLLQMDQSAIMLQQFDLGKMGRRLALWHKIQEFQAEIRNPATKPKSTHNRTASAGSVHDSKRLRSASVGPVLPRIPSLLEDSTASLAQQNRRSVASQRTGTLAEGGMQSISSALRDDSSSDRLSPETNRETDHHRRHSSMDYANPSTSQSSPNTQIPARGNHNKQNSFDQSWTMDASVGGALEEEWPRTVESLSKDSRYLSAEPTELGMTVVSALDLDRGYFSGNEAENRRARNVLRKRDSPTHARAPSDGYGGHKRLSYVFRQQRTGSTDSIPDAQSSILTVGTPYGASQRTASSPQFNKTLRSTSPMPPTVTKLEYNNSPSIDTVAASPPSSTTKGGLSSPGFQNRFSKSRATGLRAISDAITGDERASAEDRTHELLKESPIAEVSRDGSSTPSVASRSLEIDDSSLGKNNTASTGKTTPSIPPAPRRKGKKETSAYTRGLVNKPPKEQMIGCDYSGWMKKKSSNLMTTWKTRLFILRGRRLSYYYSEDDTEEKGLIDISFHRVLPANNDRITGLHATVTGAANTPISPQNASIETIAASDAAKAAATDLKTGLETPSGMFIFKLVPPRVGLSKAVNFTKPTVHYFAVDNVQQGRLWMAALMKATIDRDENAEVITTYNQKTISLAKAKAMRHRPPFLAHDEEEKVTNGDQENEKGGLNIEFNSNEVKQGNRTSMIDTKDESLSSDTKRGSVASSSKVTASSILASINGERPSSSGAPAETAVDEKKAVVA